MSDVGGRRRALPEDRTVDWMGVEERRNDAGIVSHHLKRFATEESLNAWIAKAPAKRSHRGRQLRLALVAK